MYEQNGGDKVKPSYVKQNGDERMVEIRWSPLLKLLIWLAGALLTTILGLAATGVVALVQMGREVTRHGVQIDTLTTATADLAKALAEHTKWANDQRDRFEKEDAEQKVEMERLKRRQGR